MELKDILDDITKMNVKPIGKFWEITQSNSGGSFDIDKFVTHRMIIEAETKEQALDIAQDLGVYFDGVDKGIDCECCGDRWSSYIDEIRLKDYFRNEKEAKDFYSKLGMDVPRKDGGAFIRDISIETYAEYHAKEYGYKHKSGFPDTRIHYLNGDVKEFYGKRGI